MQTATPNELITALGGPVAVARLLSESTGDPITSQAVTQWKTQGIPRARVAELALARGRVLTSSADVDPSNWRRLFPELTAPKAS